MKGIIASAVLAASIGGANAQACSQGTSQNVAGNWFCSAVNAISFTGLDNSGSYNKITNMNGDTCSSTPYGYSGPMSPLDEEVSLHVRGPINFNRFAAYSLGSSGAPNKNRRSAHGHAHARRHRHKPKFVEDAEKKAVEKRGDVVVVTATTPWLMTFTMTVPDGGYPLTEAPPATPVPAPAPAPSEDTTSEAAPTSAAAAVTPPTVNEFIANTPSASPAASSSSSSSPSSPAASGSWGQTAYYEASSGTAHGLTFLGNHGGQGSGTFDNVWGSSLSYLSSDGCNGAASPEVLSAKTLPSNEEFTILTSQECNGDCGTTRPGSVAYHGFDGPDKAFFFEFSMPADEANTGVGANGNMPAIWMLNAQIPRTVQYDASCSCWESGCGEFDIFEVLNGAQPSCDWAKATLHGNAGFSGGDSDYFQRPTDASKPITLGVVMYDSNIHVKIMDNFDWSGSLDSSVIGDICQSTQTAGNGISLFEVAP